MSEHWDALSDKSETALSTQELIFRALSLPVCSTLPAFSTSDVAILQFVSLAINSITYASRKGGIKSVAWEVQCKWFDLVCVLDIKKKFPYLEYDRNPRRGEP